MRVKYQRFLCCGLKAKAPAKRESVEKCSSIEKHEGVEKWKESVEKCKNFEKHDSPLPPKRSKHR